ncbi:RHS repeat-associated core domain-containing protein [Delftia sp. PS-11]|uniref:RHS repeat-associated core domain-containing protein n=1 Tax=Delftia sp. PS-11 TaxID=2767222 RepID=UPI0024577EE1|nr:RHS repeat-associated core domain-containing protein [Delftia sp. PS-11]KAJ8743939.1 RHS repeat protein [Delftia sp. PS-11]
MSANPETIQLAYGACVLNGVNEQDFVLDGTMPLHWQRTYLSDNAHTGPLGRGWTVPISLYLLALPEQVVFLDTQGRRISFPPLQAGQQFYSRYEHITLRRVNSMRWEIVSQDGTRLLFGPENDADATAAPPGYIPLAGVKDSNGNGFALEYDVAGLPVALRRTDGVQLGFTYDWTIVPGSPRLMQVLWYGQAQETIVAPAKPPLLVSYRYSKDGDLSEVVDDTGMVCQRFSYVNHQLVERQEAGGLTVRYDWSAHQPQGKVLAMHHSTGTQWHMRYDEATRKVQVTQSHGELSRSFEQCFDADGHLLVSVDALGGVTRLQRDAHGNVLSYTDAQGNITTYEYDSRGRTTAALFPDGSRESTQWLPGQDKPAAITDALERTTRFEWDERGNLLSTTAADGSTTRYHYDQRGLPVTITDALGKSRQLQYNALGQLTQYTDCSGQPTQLQWDLEGNVVSITDALGHKTLHHYTRLNRGLRLTLLRAADGSEQRFAHDPAGRLIAHQDPLGQNTRYQLDAYGNPLARTNALGHSLQYAYDGFGRLTRLTNENGAHYRFAWDAQDRLLAEQGFDGRRLDYRYNRVGHLLEMVDGLPQGAAWMGHDPAAIRTCYQRDAMGRMLERHAHKHGQPPMRTRLSYDAAGQLTMARNAHARVQLLYSPTGQIASEILHTRLGQQAALTHRYDLLGNRICTTLPDGRTIHTLTYGSGHVHQIHIDGEVICDFERDALHREIERSQGTLRSRYQLDPLGRLLASQAAPATQQASAAPAAGMHNTTSGQSIARRYSYDAAGQLQSIDDSRSGRTLYQYDAIGRLTQALAGHAAERFAFDPAHNLIDPEQPPPPPANPASARTPGQESADEQWARYVREHLQDPLLNLLQSRDKDQQPGPDPAQWDRVAGNRLKVWQEHRYQYDTWGNCTHKRSGKHQIQHYTWDAQHQLIAVHTENHHQQPGAQAHWRYAYDPFGRRIAKWQQTPRSQKAAPDSGMDSGTDCGTDTRLCQVTHLTHFLWDGNRLLAEHTLQPKDGQHTISHRLHLYEPDSFVPLAQVHSLWNQEQPAREQALANPFVQQALHAARNDDRIWNTQVLPLQRKLQSRLKGVAPQQAPPKALQSQTLHVHTDHLGTPRELTNADGHIVWAASYKAWGATASIDYPAVPQTVRMGNTLALHQVEQEQDSRPEQHLRFQGQYFDMETGLHYNRFRYYDPDVGRFVSQDPIRLAGGFNVYQYALNPVDWIDPLGLAGARSTQTGPNIPGGSVDGLSTAEGGKGITNAAVQRAYDRVPNNLRRDYHGHCAEADAMSKAANYLGITTDEELKNMNKNSTSAAYRNDKKGKPMIACPSCAWVQKEQGIKDDNCKMK